MTPAVGAYDSHGISFTARCLHSEREQTEDGYPEPLADKVLLKDSPGWPLKTGRHLDSKH